MTRGNPSGRLPEEIRAGLLVSEVREAVETGMCPWCGRGPFRALSQHTRMHDVSAADLRLAADLPRDSLVCSPEYSQLHRDNLNALPRQKRAAIVSHLERGRARYNINARSPLQSAHLLKHAYNRATQRLRDNHPDEFAQLVQTEHARLLDEWRQLAGKVHRVSGPLKEEQ